MEYLTTEKVAVGHPDNICDNIAMLTYGWFKKKYGNDVRVACEVIYHFEYNAPVLLVFGETNIETEENDLYNLKTLLNNYFDIIDVENPLIKFSFNKQSSEIYKGTIDNDEKYTTGDQSIVYGFANNEKENDNIDYPQYLAGKILLFLRKKEIKKEYGVGSDGKVLVKYVKEEKLKIKEVSISINLKKKLTTIQEKKLIVLLENKFERKDIDEKIKFIFIPFYKGGVQSDTGLTGRKLIANAYGAMVPHGGGNMYGKDFTKPDFALFVFARFLAISLVSAHNLRNCLIQLSTKFGSSDFNATVVSVNDSSLYWDTELVQKNLDKKVNILSYHNIIKMLNLEKFDPINFVLNLKGNWFDYKNIWEWEWNNITF